MLEKLADAIWQPWLLGLFLLAGLWFSIRSGFFQLFGLKTWWLGSVGGLREMKAAGPGVLTRRQALATSLSSTVGTGSIAGVAAAIYLGGPGAVLWMWVSALLGLMTGFVEKALAVKYRHKTDTGWAGGPAYWLGCVLHRPLAARWFSLWCVLSALAGGAVVQSNSIAGALNTAFGWNQAVVGLCTALAVGVVCLGGVSAVGRASEKLAPMMAVLFLGTGTLVIFLRLDRLPRALGDIWSGAFSPAALSGGMAEAALRYGVARGVFTNEAGVGSSALAHAAADSDSPLQEGFLGMFEVFFATLVVCSVTALAILTSGIYVPGNGLTGASLAAATFSSVLGPVGAGMLAAAVLLFAFTSLLGWCWYGEQSLGQLTGRTAFTPPYRLLYLFCIGLGSCWTVDRVWAVSDICTAAMAVVTIPAMVKLSPAVLRELIQARKKPRRLRRGLRD